jgi:hypothetical protein
MEGALKKRGSHVPNLLSKFGKIPKEVMLLVDRGDPSGDDWYNGPFTKDANWHEFSFASIVPPGTKAVLLRVSMGGANAAGHTFAWRKKGNTGMGNLFYPIYKVNNLPQYDDGIVFLNQERKAEYIISTPNLTAVGICIRGWFI